MNTTNLFVTSAICLATCIDITVAQETKPSNMATALQESYLIIGELVDGNSDNIIVCKAHEHPFSHQIIIPVVDGKFRLVLPAQASEAYMLIPEENFESFLRPYVVFPEESVHVKLYPGDRYQENSVSGSPLTEEYHRVRGMLQQRVEARELEVDSLRELVAAGNLPESVVATKDSLLAVDHVNWQDEYISKHPSLVSYQFIKELALMSAHNDYSQEIANKHYPAFAALFPDHPYTESIGAYLNGQYQLEEGKQYISFTAEDLDGNLLLADTLLAPKATLLNFWASWCGPCISKTRTMVPVYEAFKDKGFAIINIARELRNTESLKGLLEREKLPWQTNLVDLESSYGVWHKYGITNEGGAMVLLDGNKRILAINPTAEEVIALLEKL